MQNGSTHHLIARQKYFKVWIGLGGLALFVLFSLSLLGIAQNQKETISLQKTTLPESLSQKVAKVVDEDWIRVGLSDQSMQQQEYPQAKVTATGDFTLSDVASGKVIYKAQKLNVAGSSIAAVISVQVDTSGFKLLQGPKLLASNLVGPIHVRPASSSSWVQLTSVTRSGKIPSYRGYFEITRALASPAKLSVVNVLPIQDYLKAVVPNELPARYGKEAIRAQAVAARNYALRPRDKFWPQFDICDSQYCQAYYGAQTETAATTQALAETEGIVAVYDGEIALALYSSSHGGYGEAYRNAFSDPLSKQFPAPNIPYLVGGPDIPLKADILKGAKDLSGEEAAKAFWGSSEIPSYDVNSPHYRWSRSWDKVTLEKLLNQNLLELSRDGATKDFISPRLLPGKTMGLLKSIQVTQRGVSGKAMVMKITASGGTFTLQKEFVIRKALKEKNRMLPSANILISTSAGKASGNVNNKIAKLIYHINGGGFGHGVGMSQLGASWMHQHGYAFPAIIQHYYKGVSLASIPLQVGLPAKIKNQKKETLKTGALKPITVPVRHGVYVKQPDSAQLVIRAEKGKGPVYILINAIPYQLIISNSEAKEHRVPIGHLLKRETVNEITLLPDLEQPERSIRAWVELVAPKLPSSQAVTLTQPPVPPTN